MATQLKNLKTTSVDLVTAGANPDAHIRLFKRRDGEDGEDGTAEENIFRKMLEWFKRGYEQATAPEPVEKEAATFAENIDRDYLRELSSEMYDCCYALSDSLCSIICDGELDGDTKRSMMFTSLDEFAEVLKTSIPKWSAGKKAHHGDGESVELAKSSEQQATFEKLWGTIEKSLPAATSTESNPADSGSATESITKSTQKEETDTMKIDKSKMTAEEQATLADLEKKYGVSDDPATPPITPAEPSVTKGATPESLHPEVAKALADFEEVRKAQTAEIEALKKSLETERLTGVAKKYEVLGKKAEELAPKLYDMQKSGGTVYSDYVALLDEQLALVEKGGLFSEIGKNTQGSAGAKEVLGIAAAEIAKGGADISNPEAIVKAWEQNPELAMQYEADYKGGK